MKLAEKQEKYPVGSLWRGELDEPDKGVFFVRRVEAYEEEKILLGTVEGYPDPLKIGRLPDDPYLLLDGQMENFRPVWLPEDIEEATQGLLGLDQELQRF